MKYKKNLGQHFLKDQNIVDKLVRHINPSRHDEIIEIGPGDGVLTKSIINKVNKISNENFWLEGLLNENCFLKKLILNCLILIIGIINSFSYFMNIVSSVFNQDNV